MLEFSPAQGGEGWAEQKLSGSHLGQVGQPGVKAADRRELIVPTRRWKSNKTRP